MTEKTETPTPLVEGGAPEEKLITKGFTDGVNQRVFTEERVAGMLDEVQRTTTHRIFNKMYEILDQKEAELAPVFLRKHELKQLEESYDADDHS